MMSGSRRWMLTLLGALLVALAAAPAWGERLKDLASIEGVRSNHLVGLGLVTGLDQTGDQTSQSRATLLAYKNFLRNSGLVEPQVTIPQLKNVALVALTAELPPFARAGQTIDVTVSAFANARSLRGGRLLMAELTGPDGIAYAVAQGNLVVGGFGVEGEDGSRVSLNIPTVGRIPNGATIERVVATDFEHAPEVTFQLNTADFTTAYRMVERINAVLGGGAAFALDAGTVQVRAPQDINQKVAFISMLENIEVEPGEAPARVIVNSATGTVVMNAKVRVMPAAVAHGSLMVSVTEDLLVSQPPPFAERGRTVVVPDTQIGVEEEGARMFVFPAGVDLDEIVQAVNQVGAAPGDLIAILEALQAAGALRAELIVI